MPTFYEYEKDGRELLVRFTCSRCGAERIESLKPLAEKAGDHYGYLNNLPLPEGWSDWLIHSRPLCEACTKALAEFFQNNR